ncbi:group II intron maturase-specific domain-containing protein [Lutispora thermophila]|uniref:group II intron maturase-specific domain-containing protein n=1 Tax=Lutispora thermophila TaxID=288966 RepID=UPI0038CBFB25
MTISDVRTAVKVLNSKIIGMRNYYGLKNAGRYLKKIDWYIIKKFTLWYNYKTQNKRRYVHISEIQQMIYRNGLQKLAV